MFPKQVFWVGAKGGLIEEKHRRRMGEAIWLFLWLVMRQTGVNEAGEGIVLYGKPVRILDIAHDTGFPIGTIHRWGELLAQQDYLRIEVEHRVGSVYFILNAKRKTSGKLDRNRKEGENLDSNSGNQTGVLDSSSGNKDSNSGIVNGVKTNENKVVSSKATTLIPKDLSNNNKAASAVASATNFPPLEQLAREKQIPATGMSDDEARRKLEKQKEDLAKWVANHQPEVNA